MKSKRDREDPCLICNHYHDYENGEPCKVCGHVMTTSERRQQESVLPSAVIPGSLYLGSYDTASRSEILKAMGITHILNTVPNNQALFRNTFTYHTATSNPPDYAECLQFVDDAIKEGKKVLVYCMTGVSRSPSIVMAYLMKHRQWRLAETYKWVKDKRSSTNLKPEDAGRLVEYETKLYGTTSCPMGFAALEAAASTLGASPVFSFGAPGGGQQQQQPVASCSGASAPVFGGGAPAFGNGNAAGQPQWSLSSSAGSAQPMAFGSGGGGQPAFCIGAAGGQGGGGGAHVFTFGGGGGGQQQQQVQQQQEHNDMEM